MTGRLYAIIGLATLFILCAIGAENGQNTPRTPQNAILTQIAAKPTTGKGSVAKPAGRRLRCTVTAYCRIPRGSHWTAKQRAGTAAVDPRVIPYGSVVHVAGRHLTAMGRHGKSGRVVDIFMANKSDCKKFGRKTMTVRVER